MQRLEGFIYRGREVISNIHAAVELVPPLLSGINPTGMAESIRMHMTSATTYSELPVSREVGFALIVIAGIMGAYELYDRFIGPRSGGQGRTNGRM
ncbi:hypothetical protein HYS97_03540 [Candidatus Daviesbacteria bacterium]|nr:hypothetical protein [Candidatus Daviesbacteria bacterium]